jgi:hypothetical protein
MQAERLLFIHLLRCGLTARYSASGDGEGWVIVTSKKLVREMGAPRRSEMVWRGSTLIECKDDGYYSYSDGEAREMRIPEEVLHEYLSLGDGSRRYWLHTDEPERTDAPGPMATTLRDEHGNAYPELIDKALRILSEVEHPIRLSAIEDAEEGLLQRGARKAQIQLVQLRLSKETIERQVIRREDDRSFLRNAYEVQELSGRLSFKRGGPQGLLAAVKARAYEGLTNYDIASCHTVALRQVADLLRDVDARIDLTPLEEYLERGGKDWAARHYGLPRKLVKITEHAVKYGAVLPCSVAQAKLFEEQSGHYPEVAKAAQKHATDADKALRKLYDCFSDIRQVVLQIADALLTTYYDATKKRGSWMMYNACGIGFRPSDYEEGHQQRSKVMAWMLQGLEAAFVHSITILSEEYDYTVIANEHDGAIIDGTVPEEAIERARTMSGFHHAEFVIKPFADEDDIEAVYGEVGATDHMIEGQTTPTIMAPFSDQSGQDPLLRQDQTDDLLLAVDGQHRQRRLRPLLDGGQAQSGAPRGSPP